MTQKHLFYTIYLNAQKQVIYAMKYIPGNLHGQQAKDIATKLVKHIVENIQNYTDILNTLPPPR